MLQRGALWIAVALLHRSRSWAERKKFPCTTLGLSAVERARLAAALIRSLEGNDRSETWNDEIERRLAAYREDPSDVWSGTNIIQALRNRSV